MTEADTLQELAKGAAEIRKRILALKPLLPKAKHFKRYITKLDDESRKLSSCLNIRADLKVGEPAVSGVEFTTTPYQTLLLPADDIRAEGF